MKISCKLIYFILDLLIMIMNVLNLVQIKIIWNIWIYVNNLLIMSQSHYFSEGIATEYVAGYIIYQSVKCSQCINQLTTTDYTIFVALTAHTDTLLL
jgi:hypothetical protein